jgi:DNA-binding IclR family transcriptional regulator
MKELAEVRRAGVAFDREEHTLGISAAGVALRDPLGNFVAISVPVPSQRFVEQREMIAKRLLATKHGLEEHLIAAAA